MRASAKTLAVVIAATLVAAAPARADGDPASDVLLSQDVFYPYAPNTVPADDKKALDAMAAEAGRKGFRVKVALIAATTDLGSAPQLFTRPQAYADLLSGELGPGALAPRHGKAAVGAPRVLVVLPGGLGGNNLGDDAGPALADVIVDPAAGSSGLAKTAMRAIGALTKAAGRPVAVPAIAGQAATESRGGDTSPLLIYGAPVLLVLLVAGVAAVRGRDAPSP